MALRVKQWENALKIVGYLKKYPNKGIIIYPWSIVEGVLNEKMEYDFGNQYVEFEEELDLRSQ